VTDAREAGAVVSAHRWRPPHRPLGH